MPLAESDVARFLRTRPTVPLKIRHARDRLWMALENQHDLHLRMPSEELSALHWLIAEEIPQVMEQLVHDLVPPELVPPDLDLELADRVRKLIVGSDETDSQDQGAADDSLDQGADSQAESEADSRAQPDQPCPDATAAMSSRAFSQWCCIM